MLAIIGASGKIGGATLNALLEHNLIPSDQIVCTTSAPRGSEKWTSLSLRGVQVRHATFEDAASMEQALGGCAKLFLVSSPRIQLDFFDAAPGKGREKDHFVAIDAAVKAGVKHIYYTSLAFANPSKSNVMTAHERTEEYLKKLSEEKGVQSTIIREGLYNESWPLYFGYYSAPDDEREEIVVAGDGRIAWTSIRDLGLANAFVIAEASEKYAGKTFYLSAGGQNARTLEEIAEIVSKASGKNVRLKVVPREEYEKHYIDEREMDEGMVKWWVKTYDAVRDAECDIMDKTFEQLLASKGLRGRPVEETIEEMLNPRPSLPRAESH